MDTLIKADIFFFLTSVVVVILAILVAVALFYIVRILRDIKILSTKVREEGDKIVDDVDELRIGLKKNSLKITGVFLAFVNFLKKKSRKFSKK